jgi:hypothetical protein
MSDPDAIAADVIAPDFIALAQAGITLKTRDRRAVNIITIDAKAGIIRGSIAMEGKLSWRRDGSFTGAPLGVAGPLDLAAPSQATQDGPRRTSLQDALNGDDAQDRAPFCCD